MQKKVAQDILGHIASVSYPKLTKKNANARLQNDGMESFFL